mmetsp:Transcript_89033/g.177128  ORF Transcript_89033/g.177128 Transcript_89033/m.177128 type:complete len:99 (-) Transcript_89033:2215-2511(-)
MPPQQARMPAKPRLCGRKSTQSAGCLFVSCRCCHISQMNSAGGDRSESPQQQGLGMLPPPDTHLHAPVRLTLQLYVQHNPWSHCPYTDAPPSPLKQPS